MTNLQKILDEFDEYIKENAMGMVCECGGGGTDSDNNKCTICNGCGIYNWSLYGYSKFLTQKLTEAFEAVKIKRWENDSDYDAAIRNATVDELDQNIKEYLK